jgi:hypothetical protein
VPEEAEVPLLSVVPVLVLVPELVLLPDEALAEILEEVLDPDCVPELLLELVP